MGRVCARNGGDRSRCERSGLLTNCFSGAGGYDGFIGRGGTGKARRYDEFRSTSSSNCRHNRKVHFFDFIGIRGEGVSVLDHEEFRVFRTAGADYIIVYKLKGKTLRKPNDGESACI